MRYSARTKITQGMSKDSKYKVFSEDGNEYFLRVVDKKTFSKSPVNYYREANINLHGDRIVQIYDCVETNDGYECYYEYVDGMSLEQYIDGAKEDEVIELASRSAKLLRSIQEINVCSQVDLYDEEYIFTELKRCEEYLETNIIIEFVRDNIKYLLDNNHNTFLHSDYHMGNIILSKKKELVVVDIEKYDYGSFYRDLLINETYNRDISNGYASAFLREYSSRMDFEWMLYNVHMSLYFVRFILWNKRKRGVMIDEKRIKDFYLEHCVNPEKMPDWAVQN